MTALLSDALFISGAWREALDLQTLVGSAVASSVTSAGGVDVIAIGKASVEMTLAARGALDDRTGRDLIIADADARAAAPAGLEVVVGEHPVPGPGSIRAGARLGRFLERPSGAATTLFLVSGGASSLCASPMPPISLEDLRAVWNAALVAGADITTLNQLRASTSSVAGGAVLRALRTPESRALIMVDNVVSGARWVASALTYDYQPSADEVSGLVERVGLSATALGRRIVEANLSRASVMSAPVTPHHENLTVAEPSMLRECAADVARGRGYRVVEMGDVVGDVDDVSEEWRAAIEREAAGAGAVCVVGVGEATIRLAGAGIGGRCQEFAWRMAGALSSLDRDGVCVARASDGRDFVPGVGGAWSDARTFERARALQLDPVAIAAAHDTHRGLRALGQLLEGGHTGWNLCDLYLVALA